MSRESQKKTIIAEPEIGDNGIGHSNAEVGAGGSAPASPAELEKALEVSLARIASLEEKLAEKESSSSDGIKELATVLSQLVPKQPTIVQVNESDGINRSTDFKGTKANVDGRSMLEAQQTLMMFRNEAKRPISIPKSIAAYVGTSLTITVNGVRVSIPCDGRTYYINESHWEHARERLAKLDVLNSNNEPQVIEIG